MCTVTGILLQLRENITQSPGAGGRGGVEWEGEEEGDIQ